ncbi:sel1 repeat family protein [Undibacterium jejuense]|uniref:Sel1 repeat family protein n=1 Tax=Undibacterium jejuense TaxID=1344949 RepID=A0A923HG88_9BURK|nr:tetratricopeptide repeat protein [Undibacterium jejuense]MBC3862465.1 sel1 repeat family protein [Undibacterium jejuense]
MFLSARVKVVTVLMVLSLIPCYTFAQDNLYAKLTELARQGNVDAQYHVGMLLNNGIGVSKDFKQAYEWFEKSSRNGDALASYKVGCYLAGQFGNVVPLDAAMAFNYKLRSAEAGYSLAQQDIAVSYLRKSEFEKAVQWSKAAADQGYPMALYNLSVFYKDGKGVPADKTLSYGYFKLAKLVAEGKINPNAQTTLEDLKKSMSENEIERAEQFVAQWKAELTPLTLRAQEGLKSAQRLVGEM